MDQDTATIVEPGLPDSQETSSALKAQGTVAEALAELRQELVGGLLYTHDRANANTGRVLETAAFLYALIELLQEHGLIAIAELDERKTTVAQRLEQRFRDKAWACICRSPSRTSTPYRGRSRSTVSTGCICAKPPAAGCGSRSRSRMSRKGWCAGTCANRTSLLKMPKATASTSSGAIVAVVSMRSARCPAGCLIAAGTSASGWTSSTR
jgi:hypothetical protein